LRKGICASTRFCGLSFLEFGRVGIERYPHDRVLFLMKRMKKVLVVSVSCRGRVAYDGAVVEVFLYMNISSYKRGMYSNMT
jgi:hypothetical protein